MTRRAESDAEAHAEQSAARELSTVADIEGAITEARDLIANWQQHGYTRSDACSEGLVIADRLRKLIQDLTFPPVADPQCEARAHPLTPIATEMIDALIDLALGRPIPAGECDFCGKTLGRVRFTTVLGKTICAPDCFDPNGPGFEPDDISPAADSIAESQSDAQRLK